MRKTELQCEVREGVRLSPQQRHVWLLQQNDQRLYRSYCVVIVEGKLRMDILAAALRETVCRHEILRSIFYRLPSINVPLQVVTDTEILLGPPLDLSALDQREQDDKIEEIFRKLRHADFQLEHGPLLQTSVAILGSEKYALLITAPALYSDAKGLRNLVEEISRCYSASLEEETPEYKPIQYADLAEWHNELLESEETDAGRSYWRKQGRAGVSSTRLSFELTGSTQPGFVPRFVKAKLPPDVVEKLEALAGSEETSVSSFLLACWQVLLRHHSGRSNIVVGAFYDGRKYEELRDAIGLLARHLPVRCRIPESLQFDKLLKQIDEKLDGLFKWQEYFNWEYFDQSNVEGTGDAFFHFCFEFENEWPSYSSEHLEFTFQQQYSCFDRYKIKRWCALQHGQLNLECHYDSRSFRHEDIERLLSEYQTLLQSAFVNPHSPIAELEILSTPEREQLLVDLNNKKSEFSQERCVHQLFEQNVARFPDYTAVRYEEAHLNYAELNVRANQLAHHLQALGVGPDTAVAICLERSLEMIVSILGILKAGGAYVPLDPALPNERLSYMLEDMHALVLVTEERLLNGLPVQHEKVVCLDTGSERLARESKENPVSKARAHNLAYVIYTSGSTGHPKGVAIEHRQLLNYLNSICQELKVPDHASFATVSTFAADLGNTSVFPALCSGGSLHVISQEIAGNPDALGDYFRRHSIDCLKIVPSHLSALLESSRPANILPRQWLVLGGEACSWELVKQIQDLGGTCQILSHYGPTEATVGVLTYKVKPDQFPTFTKNVPLGRPLANDRIYLLNSCLTPVSIWMQGELYIGGNGLARGYVNHPALTAEKFLPDPFSTVPGSRLYRTGDLARFLPDRNIEFLGRIDHQVKINGYRIEPGEIEVVLRQHPLIKEALVFPREDASGKKRLVVYLIQHDAHELDTGDLRTFLRRQLPEYMVPSVFVPLKALPLTANGKIDYRALPEPDQTLRKARAPFIAPRDELEQQIVEIWQETLGVPVIGVHDNFFDLGGHSLLAVRLVALIKRRLGLTLPLAALFRGATVEQLASILRQEEAAKISSPLVGIQPHGS
ncbi:MAG TPA: amino acid adenylation domain-containing protein, partial [Pyrinomonadaceae bacterium]|nr:amino acid adenylation domain-containing protein [Pyrinomonadaceae bacterium]